MQLLIIIPNGMPVLSTTSRMTALKSSPIIDGNNKKEDGLSMNDRQKMIEELMKHPIGKDDAFCFHCNQCGECCRDRVDILLSPFDLCRMAKALNKPLPDVLQEYGNLYLGNTSKMPLVSLKMREDNGKCPFLMDDNRCKIHSNKPTVCALYPLGRGASREAKKAKIFYILQPTTCGGMDEIHTPREWMGEFNLLESEQWFSVWQDIVMEISEQIRIVLPQMPGRSGDELLMGITEILYLHYEVDKPLIPQVKENGKLAEKMLMMVKGTLKEYIGWRG